MQRYGTEPRPDWQRIVESQGMHYHTLDGVPYWDESAHYEFSTREIDSIEQATYALDQMCQAAVQRVFDEDLFDRFLIPPEFRDYMRASWENDEQTIYGRFDLSFDGEGPPKLLEYNADTPTALLEAAVIQWHWLKDVFPDANQFNSIHERLLEAWQQVRNVYGGRIYFASMAGCLEDYMTVNYLRDVATQAGIETAHIQVEDIGYHPMRRCFTDKQERPIEFCFKLYPWEWMQRDQFGPYVRGTHCRWLEPPWKAILSNKAILPVLWEMYPDNPYLLAASFEPLSGGDYVQKPILGREGANIQVFHRGQLLVSTDGPYDGPSVYQETCPLPRFDGRHFACVGSWFVNGWACGIGIREDENLVTGNTSRFVPHLFS
jgi:glutathionylspermidine synthase